MTDLCDLTAIELRRMIGHKDISPIELVDSCIDRIESVDGQLNAIVTKSYERARAEARDA
ncbi:MAG: amidase, partial [Porticoccaceae bacterium]|nr:amidase [Porticoccaceae bacterium]